MKTAEQWLSTALAFAFDPDLDIKGRSDAIRRIQADALRSAAEIAVKAIRPENSVYLTDAQAIRSVLNTEADKLEL